MRLIGTSWARSFSLSGRQLVGQRLRFDTAILRYQPATLLPAGLPSKPLGWFIQFCTRVGREQEIKGIVRVGQVLRHSLRESRLLAHIDVPQPPSPG